jgi:hypothetical protein
MDDHKPDRAGGGMGEAPKSHWPRAAFVLVTSGGTFVGMLLARRAPSGKAFVAGILVALIPASLLALLVLCERMKWQFSLSALLTATTLVAIVLGIVAWVVK